MESQKRVSDQLSLFKMYIFKHSFLKMQDYSLFISIERFALIMLYTLGKKNLWSINIEDSKTVLEKQIIPYWYKLLHVFSEDWFIALRHKQVNCYHSSKSRRNIHKILYLSKFVKYLHCIPVAKERRNLYR